MSKRIDRTAEVLKYLRELPVDQARRVAGFVAGKADPRAKDLPQQPIYDDLLEAAADAMQRAVEMELVPFIEQASNQ